MKIDDLVANLERNAQEQDRIMTEKIQNVTNQHLASYNELLQSNLKVTESIIKDHQASLQQDLKSIGITKTIIGAMLGLLIMLMLGLSLGNLWLYKKIQNQAEQLAELQRAVERTPPQTKALMKLDIGQNQDGTIWIQPKNPKKFKIGKDDKDGNPLILLE